MSKCDEINLSWINGDGDWRIILIKEGSAVNSVPTDGTNYFFNNSYGLGSNISGNYVVSNNITNNVTIKGLKQNTTYHVAIFEHDGISPDYLLTNPTRFSFTTENIAFDAHFEFKDSCQYTNIFEFKNNTKSTFSGLNYRWEVGDGTIILGDTANHTYNQGGRFTVVLRVLNPRGCTSTFTLPKKVLCVPRPRSRPREENSDTIQCLNGNIFNLVDKTQIDNVTNASFTGMWTFPSGRTSTFPREIEKFLTPGNKIIKYISETEMSNVKTGCTDSISLVLKVVDNPGNSIKKGDTIQCFSGNEFSFENDAGNLILTRWSYGDTDTSLNSKVTHKYKNTGIYYVQHKATTIEGCSSSDTFPVVVKPNKDARFTISKSVFCLNEGPAIFTPTDNSGSFYGLNIIQNSMYFKDTGNQSVIHIVDDSICPDTVVSSFRVKPIPSFTLRDTTICGGGSITYFVNTGSAVLWENTSTNFQRTFTRTGKYWAKASLDGCSYSDTFSLYVGAPPVITFPKDTLLCDGQALVLKLLASAGTTFNWSDGSRDSIRIITSSKTVTLTATNGCGSSSKTISVRYLKDNCDLFMPNAFSPNSTQSNEFFTYVVKNQINVELFEIYNRWGNKVYSYSQDILRSGWDGNFENKPCPEGIYVYRIIYNTGPGSNLQVNTIEGVLHLIR
ncbi:PKD domain-containing protein [Bacteroidia bacterium]|nr:PKD domain-containing protein [Bacteroidia bacterium]